MEIMTVITVLGVLSSIAIAQYGKYKARARRPEAFMALRAVADAQQLYFIDNQQYSSNFDDIPNFGLENARRVSATEIEGLRYTYRMSVPDGDQTWLCTASGNIDDDSWLDSIAMGKLFP